MSRAALSWITLSCLGLYQVCFAFEFETCDKNNDYLEAKLKEAAPAQCIQNTLAFPEAPGSDSLQRPDSEISCIATSMSRFSKSGAGYAYKKCPSWKSIPQIADRPCLSANYVRYMYDRFKNASRCVFHGSTITSKETFPLFALESGFHLNVTSGSGCRGIGQLSNIAVQEMDALDLADAEKCEKPYTRASLYAHSECSGYEKNLTGQIPDHSKRLGECEVIAIPENPDANLFYSLRLYRMLKDDKANSVIEKNISGFNSLGISSAEIENLKIQLARAMYNGGYPSIQATFNAFMKTVSSRSLTKTPKGETLWSLYQNYIYRRYPAKGEARRREVRDYVSKIEKAKGQIEERTGGSCF